MCGSELPKNGFYYNINYYRGLCRRKKIWVHSLNTMSNRVRKKHTPNFQLRFAPRRTFDRVTEGSAALRVERVRNSMCHTLVRKLLAYCTLGRCVATLIVFLTVEK